MIITITITGEKQRMRKKTKKAIVDKIDNLLWQILGQYKTKVKRTVIGY